ncbi:MAG: hypothetical protein PHR81_05545 [Bacteroidales bacterium]|jgi:hypothetical protein|nr:hypothetical protein [Bacteroidales bacterium]MDD4214255.1 hypothetical protein [Bacteroidales bacterium]
MKKYFDTATILVIVITLILFIVALFVKGLTHDLLLEAGILLVSVKLILNGYRNNSNSNNILEELNDIKKIIEKDKQSDLDSNKG